jgi:uncharacterized protein YcgI (DUF1989 family)
MVVDTPVNLSVGTSSTIGDQTTLDIVRIDEPRRGRGPRIRRRTPGVPGRSEPAYPDADIGRGGWPLDEQSVGVNEPGTEWKVDEVRAGAGGAWRVPAGGLVRVTDVQGGQSGDVFFVDAVDVTDGLSNGRSFDYNGMISLTVGATLFSSRSRTLATIIEDDVGRHDFLYTPCSQEMFEIQYGVTSPHPNCYQNLTEALSGFGVPAATVTVAFNVFMCTSVAADGRLSISPPRSRPGDSIIFRAERDLIVAVSACPAPGANGGAGTRPLAAAFARPI